MIHSCINNCFSVPIFSLNFQSHSMGGGGGGGIAKWYYMYAGWVVSPLSFCALVLHTKVHGTKIFNLYWEIIWFMQIQANITTRMSKDLPMLVF